MTHTEQFEKVESNRDRRFSMNNSPRMKLLTLCIGAALVQMASLPTLADSAVGADTVNGNAANPGYASNGPVLFDEDAPAVLRSPSGQMYSFPPAKDSVAKGQAVGSIDVGVTRDSDQTRNAKRNEYTDIQKNGVVVNNFKLAADSDAARYFSVNGGGVGRADQFYDLTVGKYNSWKVKTFYNETQHIFTENWKSLYSGEGTGNLVTGLEMPKIYVAPGAYTGGVNNYIGANTTGVTGCTAIAPCWSYNGKIYGNTVALAAINGTTGTPNATTGVITAGTIAAPGVQSNMAAAIAAKLNATPYSELGLLRKKSGVRGDINLTDSVKAYVSYNLEKRVGARPFAMNDANASTEIAEPINYNTHDILAGLSYSDDLTQANVRASSSMFRNNISTMNVQYALLGVAGANGVIQHATYDLAPDNDSYNLKGEFARSLPDMMKGRFTASASMGSNRQNEALLAPISAAQNADLTGTTTLTAPTTATSLGVANPGYTANGALVSNWNTTDALSRKNAGQRIDNKLVELALSLKPVDDLNVKGSYRFFETENKGGYIAYNPLTGQFGRGPSTGNGTAALDLVVGLQPGATLGSAGSCYTLPGYPAAPSCIFGTGAANLTAATFPNGANTVASGTNVPVFGQARTTRQSNYGVAADYDLNRTSSINGSIEREDFYRTFRERNKTEENKVKVGYVNRALGDATLRVSYEKDTKRGSNYNYRTFEDLGQGLPGLDVATLVSQAGVVANGVAYPLLVAGVFNRYSYFFRKYDLANRDQKILNTRVNYQATTDLDVGLNMQVKRADYPEGMYGLKKDNQDSLGVDMAYQPTFDRIVTAFYNYQKGQKVMMMNSGTAGANACTAANLNTYGIPACSDTVTGLDGARPYTASWASDTTDYNNVLGLGLQEDLGFARLGFDYTFARSSTHIAYNYGSTAFNATTNAAIAAIAGTALPDMTTVQNTVTLNLVKPLDKKTTVRAVYRYDGLRIKDWHYDGVIKNTMAAYDAGTLLLDGGPMNYHVNTIGIFLNYKL